MPYLPPEAFQFTGPTYQALSQVFDAERSINLYPEQGIKSSKSQVALFGRPGLSAKWMTLPKSPARALWTGSGPLAGQGRLFAVGGSHFYELKNDGTVLTDYGAIPFATDSTFKPCTMYADGTQLLLWDNLTNKIYNINAGGPSVVQVFTGNALEYMDGFYVAIANGASLVGTNPNQINVSANLDGTNWPALSYVLRTGGSDLVNGLAVLNNTLYILGQNTIEAWYDAGNAVFPFARISGATINLGCASPNSIVKFRNTFLWLGSDRTGYGQVYQMNGLQPQKVSNPAIEAYLNNQGQAALIDTVAVGYQEAGHTFYRLFGRANSGSTGWEVVYDLDTGLWHERQYSGAFPCCFTSNPQFLASGVPYGNFIGDGKSGDLYGQGINYASDGGTPITYTRTAPHISNQNQWVKYRRFELDCNIGSASPILDYSNDGGLTFNGFNYVLRNAGADAGAPGGFRRFFAMQLGRSRDRVFKVTCTSSTELIRYISAYVDANPGTA